MVKPVVSLAFLAPLLLGCACALLTACGGGGGSSAPQPPPPPPTPQAVATLPEGFWQGSVQQAGGTPSNAYAIVLGNGDVRIAEDNQYQVAATFAAGTATGFAYAPAGQVFSHDLTFANATLVATAVTPRTRFSGSAVVDGASGSFTFDRYQADYDTPLAMADLEGTYSSAAGANSTGTPLTLDLTDYLILTGSGPGGLALSGSYVIPDPGKSAFKVFFTLTGGPANNSSWIGMGAATRNGGQVATLALAASGSSGTFSGTFTRN